MQKLIIMGGGGHSRVLIGLIKLSGRFEIIGILDPQNELDSQAEGISVLGSDDLLPELYSKGITNACIAIGSIKENSKRKILYEKVKRLGFSVPSLVHPGAIISENVKLSEGIQIMAGAIIQTGTTIGENTIINTGAIIDHDCKIGRHVHICPGVVVSGGITVDDDSFIGAGSTIIQGIKIGKGVTVAAGSVVVKDVPNGYTVKGVPAK